MAAAKVYAGRGTRQPERCPHEGQKSLGKEIMFYGGHSYRNTGISSSVHHCSQIGQTGFSRKKKQPMSACLLPVGDRETEEGKEILEHWEEWGLVAA